MAYGTPEYLLCRAGREPALDDLLRDPTTHAVMASDHVQRDALHEMLLAVRAGLMAKQDEVRALV
ncbi:MAG: hypothetical protein H7841_02680 [Magnetospirillum sp. WYHS-4]